MDKLEQNTAIANEPRKEIEAYLAARMLDAGFHVFIGRTDEPLTYALVLNKDFEKHVFTAPMMEVAQNNALEALCTKFDNYNDYFISEIDIDMSLKDYAYELFDNEESSFMWQNDHSDWENIHASILIGETKYLRNFLNDFSVEKPLSAAELLADLDHYETTYLKGKNESMDKTYAYDRGFVVVHLDISTEERKNAVSEALKNIINKFGERNDMSQPYKNLLKDINPTTDFLHAFEGHLSALKYALRNAETDKELCVSMLDSIKRSENNPKTVITIKGYDCLSKDTWGEHGVTYNIGQSVDDPSFYYARATNGKVTRDYEYDHEPSREKVMSDHADKLAEEYVNHYEAEHGADGYRAFSAPKSQERAENIRQMQDISHNTTNAVPSARRGESRGSTMEQSTNFAVSSISKLEGEGPAKAIGTLVVNGEFAVHGIRVVEGQNGLYAAMPSERQENGEYKDVVFPVTKDARAAIENAVLDAYEKLAASPEKTLKNDIPAPETSVSKVYAQMHEVKSDTTQTKAAGQMTIDDCLVVTGVKMNEGTNAQGQTKTFVAMPAKPNANGKYDDIAHAITKDFHDKIDKSVIASVNNIGRYEYKGVKYSELGENPAKSAPLHPKFADKLMAQLDKAGIPYQAKCAERTTISVAAENKTKFDAVKKELTDKLNAKDKPQQTQEQKQTTGTHSKPKK